MGSTTVDRVTIFLGIRLIKMLKNNGDKTRLEEIK